MDPYTEYSNFKRLRDKIMEYNHRVIDNWLNVEGIDGLFFSDDWGSQEGLFMKPEDWRKFYKPCYKELFDRTKSGGLDVWMHLDGNIKDIIPDLIEIGLDVYNPVQNDCMDIEWLGREFGGHLCFNGGVDVQGTLVHGSTRDVKREVYELVNLFGRFNGGYIGGTSHSIMPETPLDNVIAVYEAFVEVRVDPSR